MEPNIFADPDPDPKHWFSVYKYFIPRQSLILIVKVKPPVKI